MGALFFLAGCGDLALEPDRIPTSMTLSPADTLIVEGEQARLRVTVLDQDGKPFEEIPGWAPPAWTLSDPDAVSIGPDGTVDARGGGEVNIVAKLAGMSARARLLVNPASVVLDAPAVYLVQAAQSTAGDVPLVAGRKALLRVFVTTDRASFYQPMVRARFYRGDVEVYAATLSPSSYLLPSEVEEGRIDRSYNAVVPGDVLQPGTEMVVELDVDGVVPLAAGSRVRIPATGRKLLDVRELAPLRLTVVPVLLTSGPDERVFNWTSGLLSGDDEITFVRHVLPIGELDLEVRESYTSSADLTEEAGWSAFLREIRVLRLAEAEDRYYYGAVQLPQGSAYGGLGYVGAPSSVGRTTASTFAHELGHNLSLRHAPCGGVASFDPQFPHDGGSIGVWGFDFAGGSGLGVIVDPGEYKDLMGYCQPRWVSDYHFRQALLFRQFEEPEITAREPTDVLLLWGSAGGGELLLEPAFVMTARPSLPEAPGPYRLDGFDASGVRLVSLDFTPQEVARGGGHFAFTVPLDGASLDGLETLTLSGPEGSVTIGATDQASPVAIVHDESTGRIRAILRSGAISDDLRDGARVTVSRGIPSRLTEGDLR